MSVIGLTGAVVSVHFYLMLLFIVENNGLEDMSEGEEPTEHEILFDVSFSQALSTSSLNGSPNHLTPIWPLILSTCLLLLLKNVNPYYAVTNQFISRGACSRGCIKALEDYTLYSQHLFEKVINCLLKVSR